KLLLGLMPPSSSSFESVNLETCDSDECTTLSNDICLRRKAGSLSISCKPLADLSLIPKSLRRKIRSFAFLNCSSTDSSVRLASGLETGTSGDAPEYESSCLSNITLSSEAY